jgi:hypothetical protein
VNRLDNIDWRLGSLFEPVDGQRFGLVTANPPFVISPEERFQYRDSGFGGDRVSETVIREMGGYLDEGAFGLVILNWHHRDDDDWPDRPLQWVEASGCDAWLIASKTADALTYAADWLRSGARAGGDDYSAATLDRWLTYYERLGIGRISGGVMVMQRRAGENWKRADHLGECKSFGSCGAMVARVFRNESWLWTHPDDAALLDARLIFLPDCRVEQTLRPERGELLLVDTHVSLRRGLNFGGHMDMHAIRLAASLDGQTPLRACIAQLVEQMGVAPDTVTPGCVAVVRKLMRAGLVDISSTGETAG